MNKALHLLWLAPVALGIGALASQLNRARLAGAVVLTLPLVIVAWAGFRHARPINHQPKHPLLIEWGQTKAYRGVRHGDDRRRVLSILGRPDHTYGDGPYEVLVYGRDEFVLAAGVENIEIQDPSAETPEGVGIGDNLALVKQRLAVLDPSPIFGIHCRRNTETLEPECSSMGAY